MAEQTEKAFLKHPKVFLSTWATYPHEFEDFAIFLDLEIKQSHSLFFKPFKPLASYSSMLNQIEELLSARDYKAAMQLSENLRSLALKGLHYFQTFEDSLRLSLLFLLL
ncbi:hypothetical protein ES319_D08G128400v1 [Gossypium barbadense]|uniref:GPI ethanolamine phosphate transferase 1 n=2 Tax=Gossypium TaxID=3633 RepID=A0A5J5QDZ8_GOSBA|nr:hypothetical protein ES319_D08G128400v1 [Gossypium barbadense]TYG57371.1 hypothetical protein ES288_D08G136200v1 [Gossypium darwinii]